jgi:hypothetical protein
MQFSLIFRGVRQTLAALFWISFYCDVMRCSGRVLYGPNISLSLPFFNTFNLRFSLHTREQLPRAYKTPNKIIVLYCLIFRILPSRHSLIESAFNYGLLATVMGLVLSRISVETSPRSRKCYQLHMCCYFVLHYVDGTGTCTYAQPNVQVAR